MEAHSSGLGGARKYFGPRDAAPPVERGFGTIFQLLGLIGTVWPIALTHTVITLPIIVWIMIGSFETQPHELEEAARIDGVTLWQAFRYVALPLAAAAIVVMLPVIVLTIVIQKEIVQRLRRAA